MSVFVAGGSRGIGRAIALELAEPGLDVVVGYRNDDESAQSLAVELESKRARPHLLKADLSTPEGAERGIESAREHVDHIDQLVHCLVDPVAGPLLEADPDTIRRAVEVNGISLLYLVRASVPLLRPGSSIFYLTSRGSREVLPGYGALGTSKALAESLVRYLAAELSPRDIRINAIDAGPLDTEAYRAMTGPFGTQHLEDTRTRTVGNRGLALEDVARFVRYVASPAGHMFHGAVLTLDGGACIHV